MRYVILSETTAFLQVYDLVEPKNSLRRQEKVIGIQATSCLHGAGSFFSCTSIAGALRLLDLCSIEIIDHDYDGKPFALQPYT